MATRASTYKRLVEEGLLDYVKELKPGKCCVRGCRRRVFEGGVCNKHKYILFCRRHPQKAYYARLRARAKERDLPFTVSYEEFCEVTAGFDWGQYLLPQGKRMSIDRINVDRGYEPGNIQALTVCENVIKQRRYDYGMGWNPFYGPPG